VSGFYAVEEKTMAGKFGLLVAMSLVLSSAPIFAANDGQGEFASQSSWSQPSQDVVLARLTEWINATRATDEQRTGLLATIAPAGKYDQLELLELVCQCIGQVEDGATHLLTTCQLLDRPKALPDTEWISSSKLDDWASGNIRLLYGRWLSQHEYYDEALVQIRDLAPENVVDPATLLFYQSVAHHQLLEKEECLQVVTRLLENVDLVPRRYSTVAELMYADLKPLKADSLDEISRMMANVERRLAMGRAGKRVRTEEEEILAKLDKMIEKMEQQQQQQQQGGGGGSGGSPSSPLPDSVPAGGRGTGDVADRDIGIGSSWGNLAPRDRQEALQDITKDLPAHYREVLEEYFRKLARERSDP
jgi:hypothetical protein